MGMFTAETRAARIRSRRHFYAVAAFCVAYLRTAITEPKQMQGPNHITGGHYIVERFGGWQKALRLAGLLPPEETSNASPEEQVQSPPEEQ